MKGGDRGRQYHPGHLSMGARPIAVLDSLRFGGVGQRSHQVLNRRSRSRNFRLWQLYRHSHCGGGEVALILAMQAILWSTPCVGLIDHKDIQKAKPKVWQRHYVCRMKTGQVGTDSRGDLCFGKFSEWEEQQRSAVQVEESFHGEIVTGSLSGINLGSQ